MRRITLWLVLALVMGCTPLAAQWQKQGVASGSVTDLLRLYGTSGTEHLWWLGTEAGIFSADYNFNWVDRSSGLYSPRIKRLDGYPINMVSQATALLAEDGVYARMSGPQYVWADTDGLHSGVGEPFGYASATDVSTAENPDGSMTVYAAFDGHGVFKREFCSMAWCGGTPIFGPDDAENDHGLWTAAGGWALDACDAHGGSQSWKAGAHDHPACFAPYPNDMDATLTTTVAVDLGPSPGHGLSLRFWDRIDTDWSGDMGVVEIAATPPYQDWQPLLTREGSWEWMQHAISLDAYSGQVLLRLRFVSNATYWYDALGWFVDDIEISATASWTEVTDASLSPIPNRQVTALHLLDDGTTQTLYAATRHIVGMSDGNIYALGSGNWTAKGISGTSYLSLDGSRPGDANTYLLAGTDGAGVHAASGGGDFTPFCSAPAPAGRFIAVSVDRMDAPGGPHGAATEAAVYQLDPSCAQPYRPYTAFFGRPLSVLADCSAGIFQDRFLVGTDGTGLMQLDCTDPTLPPVLLANEGQTGGGGTIASKNISKIALSPTTPMTLFAASASEGLYKSRFPVDGRDYFVRHFYDPVRGGALPGTALALAPGYDDTGLTGNPGAQTLYLGTRDTGVLRSDDGGSTWSRLANSPQGEEIVDLAVVDLVGGAYQIFALTAGASVWRSDDSGQSWTEEAHLDASNDACRARDLAVSPHFISDCTAFAATSSGLYKRTCALGLAWEPVDAHATLSVAVAPLYNNDNRTTNDRESTSVLAGTEGSGLLCSFVWGDADTFQPILFDNPSHDPLENADIPVLAMHPMSDLDPNREDVLYHCFLARHRDAAPEDGVWCMSFLDWGCPSCFWEPWSANGPTFDGRITDLAFHPWFNRLGATPNPVLYAAHQSQKVFKGVQQWGFDYAWTPSEGFFHTPPFVYAIAESPDLPGVVLAGTKGYGPMMSFDGGVSYYPWGSLRKDGYVLHDVPAAAFTHNPGEGARLLVSAGDPDFPATDKDFGVFHSDYSGPAILPLWSRASLCLSGCTSPGDYSPSNFDGHQVLELRYFDLSTDIMASDFTAGPLKSDPADPDVPGALGQFWQVETSGLVPESISDLSFGTTGTGRSFHTRGKASFIWGAQGTIAMGFSRATSPGAYRYNPNLATAAWEEASGSGACALPAGTNWRAVLSVDVATTLLGARDGTGIYRSDNADTQSNGDVCWTQSDMGMGPGDRDYDYAEYSKRVTAFVKASNGLLAALEEDELGGTPGGVFFSDSSSGGRAWVPITVSFACPSNYELASGSQFFTGTTCDGVYAASTIDYTGQPTAFFTATPSDDPWHENKATFTDHSAGNPATRVWDFGDGSPSSSANPAERAFETAFGYAAYTITLISEGQFSSTDTYQETVELVNTLITGIEKVGDDIRITWDEVSGGGHSFTYQLRQASGASGSGNAAVAACVPSCTAGVCTCQFTGSDENEFYKVLTFW